ncbi:hypothetical protein DC498_16390 [Terrimonas sp.]|uniref:sigma-70 family RNA polymerase sigma factor n=1 Tax=Terrimonas sp. TaxID=1914338 RepID=UPI000D5191CF|nr:sigma-70 family RNA polymerase sigma factor [Terrimonas sp.]PVD51223.1 hypothetical protein DC498_16390 [Terrimonas sp.]
MRNDIRINHCWKDFVLNESRESYYELYKNYYAYLCYIGLKKGMGTETVKDTINDVFLYLWEKRKTLGHIQHPHNYILTFFHRSILKKIEQSGKIQGETIENIDEIHRHFTEPSIEENILDKENNKRLSMLVNRHLNYLPRQQREIMYQKFFLGLSYAEIAKANKLSVNTVYNTVYAAMQKLRSSLPARVVASLISACVAFFLIFS